MDLVTSDFTERFERQGFADLTQFAAPRETRELRRLCMEVLDGNQYRNLQRDGLAWIFRPEDHEPRLLQSDCVWRAREIASRLLDVQPHIVEISSRLFHKPALHGFEVPWHQDRAYAQNTRTLTCWLALDDATRLNGCMVYVPRSAGYGLLPHASCMHSKGLTILRAEVGGPAIAVELPAGGCVFHGDLTLHYSGPNHSRRPRCALALKLEVKQPSDSA